jgi:hypothetical protein
MQHPTLRKNQDRAQRSSNCVCRINSTECGCRPHSHTKTGFQDGLTTVVRPHKQVFVCRRTVFEGWLDWILNMFF